MHRLLLPVLFVFCLLTFCYSCSTSSQSYEPPEKKDLGDNRYEYVNSPLYKGSEAGAFNPELGSAEAAVAKFLSSKARQDNAWKDALVPEAEWTDRLKRKLEEWKNWKITKWQLKSLQIDQVDLRTAGPIRCERQLCGTPDDSPRGNRWFSGRCLKCPLSRFRCLGGHLAGDDGLWCGCQRRRRRHSWYYRFFALCFEGEHEGDV